MTAPVLVLLHGVGKGEIGAGWRDHLSAALVKLGYPNLDEVQIIEPKYPHSLRGNDERCDIPGIVVRHETREAARSYRREFEQRTSALEFVLGQHSGGNSVPAADAAVKFALDLPIFVQAKNYLEDENIRAHVLRRVLNSMPHAGNIVLVGHSLGSVVAADVLRRLPNELRVVGMVTIGSPLASSRFGERGLAEGLDEAPANLDWWVNYWNVLDPVSGHRGLSSRFPWVLDRKISSSVSTKVHSAATYLANPVIVEAIGYGLFGSRSQEIVKSETGIDIPLDLAEQSALLALRYGHLVSQYLDKDVKARYVGALRAVQVQAIDEIQVRNERVGRRTPYEVSRLHFNFSDPLAVLPTPRAARHLSRDEAAYYLVGLHFQNVLAPFEIDIPAKVSEQALADLSSEMGVGSVFGRSVVEAAKEASDGISTGGLRTGLKWGAIGVGAVLLVVASGGLVLAAAPGLAGGAAIVSALASFGPGGMIGGLITAGALTTLGGSSIVAGLVGHETSPAALERILTVQLASMVLRDKRKLDHEHGLWAQLTELEVTLRRQFERVDEFSDGSAASVKELKQKIGIVERALRYLREQRLEPGGDKCHGSEHAPYLVQHFQ